jgi:hypothetical protein
VISTADEEELQGGDIDSLEIVHGKDAEYALDEMLKEFDVRPGHGFKILKAAFDAGNVSRYPSLFAILTFLSDP